MKIISLHNGHDASVTAMDNGDILFHWELERHFNKKHFTGVYNGNTITEFLKCYALPLLGWDFEEIEIISLSGVYSKSTNGMYNGSDLFDCVKKKYGKSLQKPYEIWTSKFNKKNHQFFCSAHHVNHMAYSFYTSPFKESLLFAYDGCGDFNTTTTYGLGKNNKIEYLGNLTTNPRKDIPDNRVGTIFDRLTELFSFFGKSQGDFWWLATPGKAMGYSSYGKIREKWKPDVLFCLTNRNAEIKQLLQKFDLPEHMDSMDQRAMDLMATIQGVCEDYIINALSILIGEHKQENICLSGGCALNVLINEKIYKTITKNIYVPPACSDTGQSLGSILYLWHHVLNNQFVPQKWHNPYLGDFIKKSNTSNKNIHKIKIKNEDELIEKASKLLIQGKIIAWAQGRGEIGPRALGNRSILCFPLNPNMKDIINEKIKHREWWRPFAPVCLFEDTPEWFETSDESPYMLRSPKVKKEKIKIIPSVVHVDGSARLQTVRESQNPLLYKLLKKIKFETGVPILLNTSLNDKGKPITNHINSIFNLLLNTDLDCAFVELEMFKKTKLY